MIQEMSNMGTYCGGVQIVKTSSQRKFRCANSQRIIQVSTNWFAFTSQEPRKAQMAPATQREPEQV